MRGITEVVYVLQGLGNTPAATNRKTGVVYINLPKWESIKPEHKLYILLHELGHIYHDTSNEFLADQYAFEKYTELGYSLTEAVYALSRVLTLTQDEHFERIEAQLVRALDYDSKVNHNDKAETILNQLDMSQELDNFNAKRFIKKAGKVVKKAAKFTPVGIAASAAKAVAKKAAAKKAAKKPAPKPAPKRISAAPATVRPTPKAVVTTPAKAFDDPLFKNPVEEPKPMPTPAPLDAPQSHWSEEVEEAPEEMEAEDSNEEYSEEVEVLENDTTDEFLKKLGKAVGKVARKVGDAAAPFADMALQKLPGGNLIVAARKAVVQNAKDKTAANSAPKAGPTPPIIAPKPTPAQKPAAKPNNNKMYIIAAVVFIVLLIIAFVVMSRKK